jgi:hypothetical protein
MSDGLVITLDVDWAPDWMVDAVAGQLEEAGVPATWFATHAGPALDRLRAAGDLFELGIHPNFLPGSTHGDTVAEVLDHVMAIVPEAVSSRSHGVVQSGELLAELVRRTPVRIDSTTFLPDMPDVRPVPQHTPAGTLVRVPFVWSDDYEPLRPRPVWGWDALLARPGLQVVLFHPARICLNAAALYPLPELPVAAPDGPGPASAFAALLQRAAGARRLRDVVEAA